MQNKSLPAAGPFFVTPEQRAALARQRFFEEGEMPSGLVPDAVIQSWGRCLRARRTPMERACFDPVTASRTHHTLARNRTLLESAQPMLRELEFAIHGSGCRFILADAQGVVVDASPTSRADGAVTRLVTRIGVNLAEDEIGTSAPGIVVKTGTSCVVFGAEHFFENIHGMYCAAAPIRDASGSLAAVLDISIEEQRLPFDVPALVGMYATGIENRLLIARSRSPLLLRIQVNPAMFGTPLEGLVALEDDGSIAWMNGTASRLLMRDVAGSSERPRAEELLGMDFHDLLAATAIGEPRMHRAANGLGLWISAQLCTSDGLAGAVVSLAPVPAQAPPMDSPVDDAPAPVAAAASTPVSLENASRQTIEQALTAARGNVSRAARTLGVSRGLLYRRLRQWKAEEQ